MEDLFELFNLVGDTLMCGLELVEDFSGGKFKLPRTEEEKRIIREEELSHLSSNDKNAILYKEKLEKKYDAIDRMNKETDKRTKRIMEDLIDRGYYNFDVVFGEDD